MAPDEYATGGGGKLKLKGSKVSDGRVEKKKKKKNKTKQDGTTDPTGNAPGESQPDRESEQLASQQQHEKPDPNEIDPRRSNSRDRDEDRGAMVAKTEAERRYEEMRRRRLQERLKKEGIKSHKERVEELNKYLSRLSEHHDMPKIGPG
ncbi:hypothetical protein PDE_00176 [Penicillium oxalicum 114-2]|uniref:DUF1754-domain-containing protein n=1 Tax=Penicillium oxalicum (strain 114-2 / CGMCC 5302) TaxID=933388 RepID=S8AHP6_PENO1|nr:hypothetical protein PDE_00176 [Penicillium oxalicum 114-2]